MLARDDGPLLAREVQERLLRFFPDDHVATLTEIRAALRDGPEFIQPDRYRWQFGRAAGPWRGRYPEPVESKAPAARTARGPAITPRCQPAAIRVICPVRPVTPPCRHENGQPGVPGCPARMRPVRAPLPARAGVLADGIQAGQRQNAPPMYLRRSSLPRGQWLGFRCVLACISTTLETGRGRTETGIHLG
jgi:hypothetical protein